MSIKNVIEFLEKAHAEATAVWIEAKEANDWELMAEAYESATRLAASLEAAYSNKVAA